MDDFDPYHKWLGIAKKFRPPTHYHLLGIDPDETDHEVIEEAALSRSAHLRGYQVGPHAALCTRLLNEIAAARLTLVNPAKRAAYDATLAPKAVAAVSAQSPRTTVADRPPADEFAFEAGEPRKPRSRSSGRNRRESIDIRKPSARAGSGSMLPIYLIASGVGVGLMLLAFVIVGIFAFAPVQMQARNPVMVQAVAVPAPPPPPKEIVQRKAPPPIVEPVIVPQPKPKQAPVAPPFVAPPVVAPLPGDLGKLGWQRKPFRILPDKRVNFLAIRPDGSLLVSSEAGLQAFDLTTGKVVREWPFVPETNDAPWLSGDGKLFFFRPKVMPGQPSTCILLDLDAARIVSQKTFPMEMWAQLAVSADRKLGVCVSRKPHLIDLATGNEIDALDFEANAAIVMPDRRYLLVATEKELFEWDTKEDKRTKEYRPQFGSIGRMKLSKDGKKAYLGSRVALQELDFATGKTRLFQSVGGQGFAIDADNGRYAGVSDLNEVTIGDLASGQSLRKLPTPVVSARTTCFAFGGRAILVGGSRGVIGFPWEVDLAAPSGQLFSRKVRSPKKVQFLPGGDALVVQHEQGLDLVSVPDGAVQSNLFAKQGQGRVKSFDIAADGKTLAYIVDGEKRVYLVDLDSRKPIGVCKGAQGVPRTILFSPDGKLLVATEDLSEFVRDKDPAVCVWNALSREQAAEEKIPTNQVYGVAAFSPDGTRYYAASYMGRELRIYDVAPFRLRQARVMQLPSLIAVSKTVPWALVPENFRFKRTILGDAPAGALDRNPEISLRSAAFSADGKHLAVGAAKVHIYRLPDLVETGTHETFGTVESVALSQDGRFLAFTCADGTLQVFPGPR